MSAHAKSQSRYYVLFILFLAYVSSYLDRQLLAMLLPSIKQEMQLSDAMLGLLTGPAFALFYVTLGFPVARLADRHSRRIVLGVSIALWSVMTTATGLARNFTEIALCRIGVGVGEAGCSPPSQSLISDLFAPEERGTALALYALGISVGSMIAFSLGGWLNDAVGWRNAFMLVGLPGLLVAVLLVLTVREPVRPAQRAGATYGLIPAWRYLFSRPAYRHLALAAGITNMALIGSINWLPSFFIRVHGIPAGQVGLWLAGAAGVAGGCGTFCGGWLADRLGRRDERWYVWLPAIGMAIAFPTMVTVFNVANPNVAILIYVVPAFAAALGVAPIYAMAQGLARPEMRAVAAATMLFAINLLGLALGPQLVGLISTALAPTLGTASLGRALTIVTAVGTAWPILHFLLAARTLRADLAEARL